MHKPTQSVPSPEKKKFIHEKHGDLRLDHYFWLRDRENPQVLEHLKNENTYTQSIMGPHQDLEQKIFQELKGRIKEDESSVPAKYGEYYYSVRFQVGQQYPLFVRREKTLQAPEQIILDVPKLAEGHSFYQATGPMMSPNHKIAAFGADTVGRRFYTVYFKDLVNKKMLQNKIENVTGNLIWAADNETVFYSEQNPETLRSEKIYRYNLKTNKKDLIFHEKDETFSTYVYKSLSQKFIYIFSSSTMTTEVQFIQAARPLDSFRVFAPRKTGVEYNVSDDGEKFYILTNKEARNFRIMTASLNATGSSDWKELIPHRTDTYIEGLTVFKNFLVMDQRQNGLTQIEITDKLGKINHHIPFADENYVAVTGENHEFDTEWLRFNYESLRLPSSVFDYNMKTHEQILKKTEEVPNFNPNLYMTKRLFISARDGVRVPVSLIMRKDYQTDGTAPMLISGYGAYGVNSDPMFDSTIFSLVDRGFVYAIAHVRGGSEMGREWYENGRMEKKKNTFYDFIDCTEGLIKEKFAAPGKVFATGGSAGGLLMGAVINIRPDLFRGVVAQVPFVDALTTMLDDSLPLTTGEYDEWGNPNEKVAYEYIKSYSPYDNVSDQSYPQLLVTSGLHDSQVQYWEAAKWVAKLRDHNKSSHKILLKMDLDSGHGGASGRFDKLKEIATEYTFILMSLNN